MNRPNLAMAVTCRAAAAWTAANGELSLQSGCFSSE